MKLIKNKQPKTKTLLATSTMLAMASFCWYAQAEKYIVKMRSPSSFKLEVNSFKEALKSGKIENNHRSILGQNLRYAGSIDSNNVLIVETEDKATVEGLKFNPEVEYVEKEFFIPVPQVSTKSSDNQNVHSQNLSLEDELTWGLRAIEAEAAWDLATEGAKGAGARVAVIDTGIDRDHPDLADRFEKGQDFLSRPTDEIGSDSFAIGLPLLKGAFDDLLDEEPADTVPYPYFDRDGHGSHVAGTVLASENGTGVVGVAPQAKVLAGRVCGQFGCSSVGIVRAIDWAVQEKVDVINLSLGGPFPSRATQEAVLRAEEAGVTVVAAAGNSGTPRLGYPAGFETVVAVGAIDPEIKRADFSQYGEGLDVMAPGVEVLSSIPQGTGREGHVLLDLGQGLEPVKANSFVGSSATDGIVAGELLYVNLGQKEDFENLEPGQLEGKIALIKRGEIAFAEKVSNAIAAGAIGTVIFNHEPGLVSGAITQDGSEVGIPVLMIEQQNGELLVQNMENGEVEEASLEVKRTDYAKLQGTSMASPHVAGLAALIKAANKDLTPAQVRSMLRFTTNKAEYMNTEEYGAGVVNAKKAIEFLEMTRDFNWKIDRDGNIASPRLAKLVQNLRL